MAWEQSLEALPFRGGSSHINKVSLADFVVIDELLHNFEGCDQW